MKWHRDDLKKYVEAKEYIDTLLIPITPFQLMQEKELEQDAYQAEVLHIYLNEIEKELSGRMLVTPPFTYLKDGKIAREIERFNEWVAHAEEQPFKHIFAFTFELTWRKHDREIDANLLWVPSLNVSDIHSDEAITMVKNQVDQLKDFIQSYW